MLVFHSHQDNHLISPDSHMGVILLCFLRPNITHKSCKSHVVPSIMWYFTFMDEENCNCSTNSTSCPLCQLAEFISWWYTSVIIIPWLFHEVVVFQSFACLSIQHSHYLQGVGRLLGWDLQQYNSKFFAFASNTCSWANKLIALDHVHVACPSYCTYCFCCFLQSQIL